MFIVNTDFHNYLIICFFLDWRGSEAVERTSFYIKKSSQELQTTLIINNLLNSA